MSPVKQLLVNLPVRDLKRSVEFFTQLGFTFDQNYTDENATMMIISENISVMLLTDRFFGTFISKPVSDSRSAEAIMAMEVGSREEVDTFADKAIAAGGKAYKEPEDHGWMYGRNFEDFDGHLWEVFFMDMAAVPKK